MVDTLPRAEIVHAIPGRVRLRVDARRRDEVYFASVATSLSAVPGVTRVEVRPLTGSLVIHHIVPFGRIAAAAEERRLFSIIYAQSAQKRTEQRSIDPKLVAAVAMGVFAIWQLGRGRYLPPALSLVMYALDLARLWPDETSAGEDA
jgi:hypothetical protein